MIISQASKQGLRVVESVLSHDECGFLLDVLSSNKVNRSRAGARHILALPHINELAHNSRLIAIARRELGAEPFPFRATLFHKSSESNWLVVWHQDTALPLKNRFHAPDWGPWSNKAGIAYAHAPAWALSNIVALRVHLDPSVIDNGPLRVVPDSHTLGVLTDEEIASTVRERESVECEVPKGGVLVMRPLLIHSSSKAKTKASRRVLHIEYAASLTLEPGIELAIA